MNKKTTTNITIISYPTTFTFTTTEKLPPFKYACPVRKTILVEAMIAKKISSPCHAYTDYDVAMINISGNNEIWHLDS